MMPPGLPPPAMVPPGMMPPSQGKICLVNTLITHTEKYTKQKKSN
jgi:hypothetical protein